MVKAKLPNIKDSLGHVRVKGDSMNFNQKVMEESEAEWKKARQTDTKADLPKSLQSRLEEIERAKENQALAKASCPPKSAEAKSTLSTQAASTTTTAATIAKANLQKRKKRQVVKKR